MRRYVLISGLFFALLAALQLVRFLLRWPVVVAGVTIPIWISLVAALIVGSLASWAFSVRSHTVA